MRERGVERNHNGNFQTQIGTFMFPQQHALQPHKVAYQGGLLKVHTPFCYNDRFYHYKYNEAYLYTSGQHVAP